LDAFSIDQSNKDKHDKWEACVEEIKEMELSKEDIE
jgi:hypothetical protein